MIRAIRLVGLTALRAITKDVMVGLVLLVCASASLGIMAVAGVLLWYGIVAIPDDPQRAIVCLGAFLVSVIIAGACAGIGSELRS